MIMIKKNNWEMMILIINKKKMKMKFKRIKKWKSNLKKNKKLNSI